MSHDTRPSPRETRVLPGDLGASGGAAPLGGDMAAAGAEGGSEESARESEAWAAAVPPVRLHSLFTCSIVASPCCVMDNALKELPTISEFRFFLCRK